MINRRGGSKNHAQTERAYAEKHVRVFSRGADTQKVVSKPAEICEHLSAERHVCANAVIDFDRRPRIRRKVSGEFAVCEKAPHLVLSAALFSYLAIARAAGYGGYGWVLKRREQIGSPARAHVSVVVQERDDVPGSMEERFIACPRHAASSSRKGDPGHPWKGVHNVCPVG
jgi:hypothetical protein